MPDIKHLIREVNEAIDIMEQAKEELHLRTRELIDTMQEEGKSREWALGYMDLVCKLVDARTAAWAMEFFNECWPEEPTAE